MKRSRQEALAFVADVIRDFEARLPVEDCFIYPKHVSVHGYGRTSYEGLREHTHRLAWEVVHGPVPEAHQVHHECEQRLCINPRHLLPITLAEHRRLDNVGEKHNLAKLTEAQVLEIRCASGSHRALGREYGVSHALIGKIQRREIWRAGLFEGST